MRTTRMILAVAVVEVAICGCASVPKGASVETEVLATMGDYGKAMRAGDVDALLAFFSEDWEDDYGATKDTLEDHFQGLIEKGGYEDTEIDLDNAEVIADGDTVTITPVMIKSSAGSTAFTRRLKKEADGVWRIVHSKQADIKAPQSDGTGPRMTGEDGQATPGEIARTLRERILSDPSRPGYHFVIPEGVAMPFDRRLCSGAYARRLEDQPLEPLLRTRDSIASTTGVGSLSRRRPLMPKAIPTLPPSRTAHILEANNC